MLAKRHRILLYVFAFRYEILNYYIRICINWVFRTDAYAHEVKKTDTQSKTGGVYSYLSIYLSIEKTRIHPLLLNSWARAQVYLSLASSPHRPHAKMCPGAVFCLKRKFHSRMHSMQAALHSISVCVCMCRLCHTLFSLSLPTLMLRLFRTATLREDQFRLLYAKRAAEQRRQSRDEMYGQKSLSSIFRRVLFLFFIVYKYIIHMYT